MRLKDKEQTAKKDWTYSYYGKERNGKKKIDKWPQGELAMK
jgi:hypothetical protein